MICSNICVSFVGIFDGRFPENNPDFSMFMHAIGQGGGFFGDTFCAFLGWIPLQIKYNKTPKEKRVNKNPIRILLYIIMIILIIIIWILTAFVNPSLTPALQWCIFLSLLGYLRFIAKEFPENFRQI